MSGIFGLFNQDGAPMSDGELGNMAALLERRGPDRTGRWRDGAIGLGHTLLTTTPEAVFEHLPLKHAETGCVVTADVRLDNRAELLAALDIEARAPSIGDAEIILTAYLAWGEGCVERLLGDFAFAIWDPRRRTLFCARDHFGMRPLYYHHTPGRFLAFASEPKAILVLPQTPYRINEGRIADFLVTQLEGIDKTSTFFEEVYRLPPAHSVTVTPEQMQVRRYWRLEPGEELRLPSNEAYAEAFLEVFTEAVRCRLRSQGPVGSMLSGGMDSGSVVAVAKDLLADQGRGPLPTFSALGPDPETCVETRTIHAALTMDGLDPHLIRHDRLDELLPELEDLTWNLDEPFDNHMTLPRAVYLAAHRAGIKVLLDGVAGDIVLGEGSHIARLIRRGRWRTAYREAVGQQRFWGNGYPAWRELYRGVRSAVAVPPIREVYRRLLGPAQLRRHLLRNARDSQIHPDFASRVRLSERLGRLHAHGSDTAAVSYEVERARSIDHPYLTVGRERYDRVASAVAVEPRDPFLDRRVVEFCLSLPGEQKLADGWPKIVLRRAMTGRLPDPVRWRTGKEHLGWVFTSGLMAKMEERLRALLATYQILTLPYLSLDEVCPAWCAQLERPDTGQWQNLYDVAQLAAWLGWHARRSQKSNKHTVISQSI
ncbi:MAG: asparagine synthetase B [Chromatiaceae bacterium]|nr:MAG: asparagine synthetase B [Chromatiaceae bacterium]